MVRRCHTADPGTARVGLNRFGVSGLPNNPGADMELYDQHSSTPVLFTDTHNVSAWKFGSSTVAGS